MHHPFRFGIIGAGSIAQAYAEAFSGLKEARVIGVADTRPDAATFLAHRLGASAFHSGEDMVDSIDLDAVLICTPPAHHPEIANYAMRRGIHVLCEKPFCIHSDTARQMIAAAEDSGVILTMASKFRYVDDVLRAKRILDSGLLGEIIQFENAFTAKVAMAQRWNSDPEISGGGVLIDNGTHSLDLMRFFLGPVNEVQAIEGKRCQNLPVDETVRIFVRSLDGVLGNIDLSWNIDMELDHYIKIYGSNGTISVGWKESKYRQSSSKEWVRFGDGYNKVDAFRNQIRNFLLAAQGQEILRITATDALASVEVVEAAYQSLAQNRWTSISNPVSMDRTPALESSLTETAA